MVFLDEFAGTKNSWNYELRSMARFEFVSVHLAAVSKRRLQIFLDTRGFKPRLTVYRQQHLPCEGMNQLQSLLS